MVKKITISWLLFVIISTIIVTSIRFNRNDFFISNYTGTYLQSDAPEYVSMTQYFRGEKLERNISAPFSYRPLIPLIASILPFDALTSINTINLISVILTIVLIQYTTAQYQRKAIDKYYYSALFVFSFPTFYYATIGIIEAPAQLMIALGIYFIINQYIKALFTLLFFSVFIKETSIILVVCFFIYSYRQDNKRKTIFQTIALLFVYIFASYLARKLSIDPNPYIWKFSLDRFLFNTARMRTYISAIITIGLPVTITLFVCKQFNMNKLLDILILRSVRLALMGIFLSIALYMYSIVSAYADARPLWYSYLFFILLISILQDQTRQRSS